MQHDPTQAGAVAHTPAVALEQVFERLNPEFGVAADTRDSAGHEATQERESGLALGTRVAIAGARENDARPLLELVGQDYRAADAARQARHWPTPAASWAATPGAELERGWER